MQWYVHMVSVLTRLTGSIIRENLFSTACFDHVPIFF